jgi:hypothetical protein
MVLISAFKKYFALAGEQKEFIKRRQKSFFDVPEKLIKFFKPLADFDKDCDAARSQCGKMMLFGVLGFICILILFATEVLTETLFKSILILFLIYFFVMVIIYIFLGRINIHNNLRNFIVPVINTLRQDLVQNEKMHLKIDLRGKCIADKKKKVDTHDPGWFSYPKITRTHFIDNWLSGSATLFDGTKISFSAIDRVVKTDKKKKNPRGKIKYKTKYKVKSSIKVGVAMKTKNYQLNNVTGLKDQGLKIKQKQKDKREAVTASKTLIFSSIEASLEPSFLLELLGKVLMSAQPARQKG